MRNKAKGMDPPIENVGGLKETMAIMDEDGVGEVCLRSHSNAHRVGYP